jgi:hypothetical protein
MATKVKRTDAEILVEMTAKMMDRPVRNLGVQLWSGASYTPRTTPIPPAAPLAPDKIGKPAGQSLRNRVNPATPKMQNWAAKLLEMKEHTFPATTDVKTLSFAEVKYIIDTLKDAPFRGRKVVVAPSALVVTPKEEMTEGMYIRDGVIYKVQMGSKGYLYALVLSGAGKFEFVKGAIRRITPADRMTLEEAKAYGKETHRCCVCGIELTNPDSIEAGIGPICAGKF